MQVIIGAAPRLRPRRFKPLTRAVQIGAVGGAFAVAAIAGFYEHRRTLDVQSARQRADMALVQSIVQDHLNDREAIARAIAAAFEPESPIVANALSRVDARVLRFVPDVNSFVWAPRVEREQVPAVLDALRRMNVADPALLGPGRARLNEAVVETPLFPVLDVLPKTDANLSSLGVVLSALPLPRAALAEARARGDVAATAPLELVQLPGVRAMVLYVPVNGVAEAPSTGVGFLGFSFRFDRLFGAAAGKANVPTLVMSARDADAPEAPIVFAGDGFGAGSVVGGNTVAFGGRTYRISYSAPASSTGDAWRRALIVFGTTGMLLLLVLAFAIHLQNGATRLETALDAHEEAEQRLRVVVGELNHRVGNIFSVTQAIVGQALKHDRDTRDMLTSRLQSMAQATKLLAETEWRGATLAELVRRIGLPFAERVHASGPDLMLGPGAAQGLVLILHELWTNAAKYGALAAPEGSVALTWRIEGDRFRLEWRERDGPRIAALPERQGFGRQLIERLGPASVNGEAVLSIEESALRYRLSAPLAAVRSKAPESSGPGG